MPHVLLIDPISQCIAAVSWKTSYSSQVCVDPRLLIRSPSGVEELSRLQPLLCSARVQSASRRVFDTSSSTTAELADPASFRAQITDNSCYISADGDRALHLAEILNMAMEHRKQAFAHPCTWQTSAVISCCCWHMCAHAPKSAVSSSLLR